MLTTERSAFLAAPESYEELKSLLSAKTMEEQLVVVERIQTCNHPSLAVGNKAKLEVRAARGGCQGGPHRHLRHAAHASQAPAAASALRGPCHGPGGGAVALRSQVGESEAPAPRASSGSASLSAPETSTWNLPFLLSKCRPLTNEAQGWACSRFVWSPGCRLPSCRSARLLGQGQLLGLCFVRRSRQGPRGACAHVSVGT